MDNLLHRRTLLLGAGAATLIALLTRSAPLSAGDKLDDAIARAIGDAVPAEGGPMRLDVPPLAENGATVPFTVTVDSPMTDDDHVVSIHIFAEGNPRPDIAGYYFTPLSGAARVTSRMRLNQSQGVVAVALTSRGDAWLARRFVKVTIGGCDA
jgi:sulfur-oxidizing protein SoxY